MSRPEVELQDMVDDRIIEVARKNPAQIVENLFHIVDKLNKVVPFHLNQAQAEYDAVRTYRDDVLKARKEGFSSFILALFTVKFLFMENVNCVCISHEDEATKRLFQKVEFYIENLTTKDGRKIFVNLAGKSKREMTYKFDRTDARGRTRHITNTFYLGTAGSKSFGRGDNIHFLHMSETAFWGEYSRVATGLLNAVPDDPNSTYIVKESTANGAGTQHHAEWVNEKEGKSSFRPHFFGWHKDPVNKLSVKDYEMRSGMTFTPSPEEDTMAVKYGLSPEQLCWRRWKIVSMQPDEKHTKEDLFKQEFPIDDSEAFLSSGKSIFDTKTLEWYEEAVVRNPTTVGELVGWNPPLLQQNSNGLLKVWEEPKLDVQYVIGADVAEKGDYSVAVVVNRRTEEQVAEWHGHEADEFTFASILYKLGLYYNTALIACEKNNQGVAVVKKLDELGYTNQFVRRSVDEITQSISNEYGWRTDSKTRPVMLADFNQEFNARRYKFRSAELAKQMRTFVRNKSGRPEAQSNCYDDLVIAHSIAIQMYKFLPEAMKDDTIVTREYTPNTSVNNFFHK